MNLDLLITGAVSAASAIVGFISGLLTPWVKWHIEKKRALLASRREQVRDVTPLSVCFRETREAGTGRTATVDEQAECGQSQPC